MFTCMSPGNIGIKLAWEQCLPIAKESGFEGLDVQVDMSLPADYYRQKFSEYGLKVGAMSLPVDFRAERPAYDRGMAGLDAVARRAREIGLTRFYMWILSFSDTLPMKENLQFHVERLGPAARILAAHGCRLGLEFLGPKTIRAGHRYPFVRSMEQMLDLCEKIGPNCGLLLDSWHWHMSLGTLDDIRTLQNRDVVYVHINDAPRGLAVDEQQDLVRALPGETGVIDLGGFLSALRTIGYDGPVVPEPFDASLAALEPAAAAAKTVAALRKVWSLPARVALPATMKAVATGRKKAWLVDLPVPRPQGHEVVVKIHASPICGSNLGAFHGEGEWINDGHEGSGEVVAVAQSNRVKVGDRVALAPLNCCGRCPDCTRGDIIFCEHRPRVHGMFAQYVRLADALCVPLPDDIDYVRGSLLGCALGPAYQATQRLNLRAFDTVVITGLGPVGMGATALSKFLGAKVVAVDMEPFRLAHARKLGADVVLPANDPLILDKIRDAAGGAVARGIECSGKEQALRWLIDAAGIRARIAIIGENASTVGIRPSDDFIRRCITLVGCWHMNINDAGELITFLRRRPDLADLLITHTFPFSKVQQAFETFVSRQSVKVIMLPWE